MTVARTLEEHLLCQGLVNVDDLARANDVAVRSKARLSATLVRLGLLPEPELAAAAAAAAGLPLITRADFPAELCQIRGTNRRFLEKRSIVPIAVVDGKLVAAVADPEDQEALIALAFASSLEVTPVVASFSDVEEALGMSASPHNVERDFGTRSSAGADDDLARMIEGESEAPVIRLVQRIMTNAAKRRASDVHIEPMARHVIVRYRIDGRLVEAERHPDGLAGPIASRIKVLAGMDIAESRLPQDGRLRLTERGRDVDVRVSTSPIAHGESIVLRLLGRTEVPLDLAKLGLPTAAFDKLCRALDRPHGIVLVTGPTGSGKTTTLYAAVNRLRRPDVKILTVEDPVEVLLEGINQVQVRPEIELSYAATLRAFLRQDPDVLMIGEIRDGETAEIALRAALTGHLVLSTLHTNSAIGAFTRLADIGIQPYLTATTVIAAVAQRLIRALCGECRQERPVDADEAALYSAASLPVPNLLFEASGCASCQQTGYRGRLPLIEVVEVDERLRTCIREGRAESDAEPLPLADTLLGHGLMLAAEGRTTISEVHRAVQTA